MFILSHFFLNLESVFKQRTVWWRLHRIFLRLHEALACATAALQTLCWLSD